MFSYFKKFKLQGGVDSSVARKVVDFLTAANFRPKRTEKGVVYALPGCDYLFQWDSGSKKMTVGKQKAAGRIISAKRIR